MKRIALRPFLTAVCAAALAIGCSSLADSSSKPGELGNGGFYFSCSDAVACSKYSNDASKFPSAVSLGSTFSVRFVPKPSDGLAVHFNEAAPDRGITVQPVGEHYLSRGPSGLAAVKVGFATLTSRDAQGQLVDYVVVRIAKPDALVIYAADTSSTTPAPVDTIDLTRGERRAFRAFAQEKVSALAGTLQVEWTSSNPSVVAVESTTDGKATLVARSAGTATLTATGGTFAQNVTVAVKP